MVAGYSPSFFALRSAPPPTILRKPSIAQLPLLPSALSLRQSHPLLCCCFSAKEKDNGAAETLARKKEESKEKSAVPAELRQMMAARKERSKVEELVEGVVEEVREIEWPEFRNVVGTTGVVLAVIAGSTVALLTVNAILAELSDRVFVGKGVQDFFPG